MSVWRTGLALAVALQAGAAHASTCPPPDFQLQFREAIVVEGFVVRHQLISDRVLRADEVATPGWRPRERIYRAEVRILNVLRGRPEVSRLVYEYTLLGEQSCQPRHVREGEYLVFAMLPPTSDAARRPVSAHDRAAYARAGAESELRSWRSEPLELGLVPMNR